MARVSILSAFLLITVGANGQQNSHSLYKVALTQKGYLQASVSFHVMLKVSQFLYMHFCIIYLLFSLGGQVYGTLSVDVSEFVCVHASTPKSLSNRLTYHNEDGSSSSLEYYVVSSGKVTDVSKDISAYIFRVKQTLETSVTLTHTASYSRRSGYSAAPL
jgi:hypothetical protein